MAGNTFGRLFSVTSFGESHGSALGCVIDGCPPGLAIDTALIQRDLDRRRPGSSKWVTQRKESDTVEILSGVFEGKSTGTPIALLIRNEDQRSRDYQAIKNIFRPGHADYTYWIKYGHRDYRGGGRSSARETVARVAAGSIARAWLKETYGTEIVGCVSAIGDLDIIFQDQKYISTNPFFVPNQSQIGEIEEYLHNIRKDGDSVGALLNVWADSVPAGLGNPVFDKLDAQLAYAMMGINAVKGVSIGSGFSVIRQKGSDNGDEMNKEGFSTNHAGGILGGISNGQRIELALALKPTPSIAKSRKTLNESGEELNFRTPGRHDPCVGLRAVPIAEAMLALVLMDAALQDRAQNGLSCWRKGK